MRLAAGANLGRYIITRPLGAGGMGEVYVARDERLGRDVAIKVLPASLSDDRERLQRFELEARAAGSLNHPNVLSVFDIGTHEGSPYIVCELLEGETLRARLRRGPLAISEAVDFILQCTRALGAAHLRGIIHRDLKPDNLFITNDNRVKVLDFGLAKLIRPSAAPRGVDDDLTDAHDLTGTGVILGTAGYMAPEQVRGGQVGPPTDVFALGAVFYEVLTGERAFKGATAVESIAAILLRDPPAISPQRPEVPAQLVAVVSRCLNKNPEERFSSACDMLRELEAGLARSTVASHATPSETTPSETTPSETTPSTPKPSTPKPSTSEQNVPTPSTSSASGQQPTLDSTDGVTRDVGPAISSLPRPTRSHRRLLWIIAAAGVALTIVSVSRLARETDAPATTLATPSASPTPLPTVAPSPAPATPTFTRVTFRTGNVLTARFSSDGESIAYSAAWDGQTAEIFTCSVDQPDAHPLGIRDSSVLAVSTLGDIAVSQHAGPLRSANRPGTLATVAFAGGPTREIATAVSGADFSPDGQTLAIVRESGAGSRLERPPGTALYESTAVLGMPRVSRDGARLAVVEIEGGILTVLTVALDGSATVLTAGWSAIYGLAWSADDRELWFAARSADGAGLWAVSMAGQQRLVLRLPGRVFLHDVSATGRLLLDQGQIRTGVRLRTGDHEREVGWLDDSRIVDLTTDGKTVLLNQRAGGPTVRGAYLRSVDGSPATRLSDDPPSALSDDALHAIVLPSTSTAEIVILPTASSTTAADHRHLRFDGFHIERAAFLPGNPADGGAPLLLTAAKDGAAMQLWVTDVDNRTPRAITPPGVLGREAITPLGDLVAVTGPTGALMLYAVDGRSERRCPGAQAGEMPISFTGDGHGLRVYQPGEIPARIFVLSLSDGARTEERLLGTTDEEGVVDVFGVRITPDGSVSAYSYSRVLASDLYVVDGVR